MKKRAAARGGDGYIRGGGGAELSGGKGRVNYDGVVSSVVAVRETIRIPFFARVVFDKKINPADVNEFPFSPTRCPFPAVARPYKTFRRGGCTRVFPNPIRRSIVRR